MRPTPRLLAPEDPPAWTEEPFERARALEAFACHAVLTVGLEEELMLLDPETFELAPEIERVLALLGDDPRFKRELRDSQLELVTPVAGNAGAACLHLARARAELAECLGGALRFAAAGTHPFSSAWGAVGRDERYKQLAEEYVAAAHGNIPCGLHVHVAVGGAERALAVYNSLRSYLPELAALAANSPYAEGADTGLACARRPLNDGFHRAGVPPVLVSWDALLDLVEWGRRAGLFPDASHFWWDLRPHLRLGTLEVRIADAQTRVEDVAAVAGVVQALAGWLAARHDAGETLPVHDSTRIAENVWRAVRYGVRGWMADPDSGRRELTRDRIGRLLELVGGVAERQGNGDALLTARALLAGNGADRQREVYRRSGPVGLTRWLAEETPSSAADYLERRA